MHYALLSLKTVPIISLHKCLEAINKGWQLPAPLKRPKILLCDEPTGTSDSETDIVVLNALLNVNRDFDTTCIIDTHNATIAKLAHRIIYFSDGNISHMQMNTNPINPEQIDWQSNDKCTQSKITTKYLKH